MCHKSFAGRIIENFVEIVLLVLAFLYLNIKIRLPVIRKAPSFDHYEILGLEKLCYEEIRTFCVRQIMVCARLILSMKFFKEHILWIN